MTSAAIEVRRQVALAGQVVDAGSGRALAGARVQLTDGPEAFLTAVRRHRTTQPSWASRAERIDRTRTAADGHFHFLDLPAGQYTVRTELPDAGSRYGEDEQQVTVGLAVEGSIPLAVAELALQATTLTGRITAPDGEPVAMAEVRIAGSGESTFSGADGRYTLTGLEAGDRTVTVAARGFQPTSQQGLRATPSSSELIDPNVATAEQLVMLPGIGPTLANRIVAHREAHGRFRTLDDLLAVSGIGPTLLAGIAPYVELRPIGMARLLEPGAVRVLDFTLPPTG